jgi:hypothetical protein
MLVTVSVNLVENKMVIYTDMGFSCDYSVGNW